MKRALPRILILAAILGTVWMSVAQWGGGRRRGGGGGGGRFGGAGESSSSLPTWQNPKPFKDDVFTFVRIRYRTHGRLRSNGIDFGDRRWAVDYKDADINLCFRLQQMTSLKVNDDPDGRVLELTDPDLFKYPFIYIVEPGDMELDDEEAAILRKYLLNGGFLMFDDFWGDDEWANLEEEMKKVFPDRRFTDVPADHAIFNGVFKIDKDKLQTPNVGVGEDSQYPPHRTWERADAQEVHFRSIADDKNRLMVLACHNTDNGDGWEREGEYVYFFREFSEKKNYPLAINILFYTMTH